MNAGLLLAFVLFTVALVAPIQANPGFKVTLTQNGTTSSPFFNLRTLLRNSTV